MYKFVIPYTKLLCLLLCYSSIQENEVCIFGSNAHCFYACRCHFSDCNTRDSNCETCNHLTGLCLIEEETCEYDDFTSSLYETRYWTGAACQKGNIAQGKFYAIEGLFEFPFSNGGATDGTFTFSVSAFISPFSHTIIVDFEGDHVVQFIDLFVKTELTLTELNDYVALSLELQNGSVSLCSFTQPIQNSVLQNSTNLEDTERMQFLCQPPSVGHHMKLKTLETEGINIPVTVYKLVVIGYKYANINLAQCSTVEGDEDTRWCTQCNNSLPPECKTPCDDGFTGINCENETETTQVTDVTASTTLIPLVVGITGGLLVCITIVAVICSIVYRKYFHKSKITDNEPSSELEEETYDELDDLAMDKPKSKGMVQGINVTVRNEYTDSNKSTDMHKTDNMRNSYLTAGLIDNHLYQTEPCIQGEATRDMLTQDQYTDIKDSSTLMQTKTQPVTPVTKGDLENDTKQKPQSMSSDYMHTKASENKESAMMLQNRYVLAKSVSVQSPMANLKVPTKDNSLEEDNPYSETKEDGDDIQVTQGQHGHSVTYTSLGLEHNPYLMTEENKSYATLNDDTYLRAQNDLCGKAEGNPCTEATDEHHKKTGEGQYFKDDENPYLKPEQNPYLQPERDPAPEELTPEDFNIVEDITHAEVADEQYRKSRDDNYFKVDENPYLKPEENPYLQPEMLPAVREVIPLDEDNVEHIPSAEAADGYHRKSEGSQSFKNDENPYLEPENDPYYQLERHAPLTEAPPRDDNNVWDNPCLEAVDKLHKKLKESVDVKNSEDQNFEPEENPLPYLIKKAPSNQAIPENETTKCTDETHKEDDE